MWSARQVLAPGDFQACKRLETRHSEQERKVDRENAEEASSVKIAEGNRTRALLLPCQEVGNQEAA